VAGLVRDELETKYPTLPGAVRMTADHG
jgi:hypothetical protein